MTCTAVLRSVSIALLGLMPAACDILTPSENEIPGAYEAVLLSTASGTTTFDSDAEGAADLLLVLHDDGSTTGYAFLPGGAGDGRAIDSDLAGRWYAGEEGVLLDLVTPSFLEELYFNRRGDLLVGRGWSSGVELDLVRVGD